MLKRTVSALIALPAVIFLLWLGGAWTALLVLAVSVMANLEYSRMARDKGMAHCPVIAIGISVAYIADAYFTEGSYASFITVVLLVLAMMRPVILGEPKGALAGTASTTFSPLYLGWSLSHAILLRGSSDGAGGFFLVLSLLGLVWMHDTAALCFGIATGGRHKIAPNISPKKSLEGSLGGFLTLIALVMFAYPVFEARGLLPHIGDAGKALLVISCAICCNYGDLGESALKRDDGLKDSGTFLPGHGGYLDRIDSLLLFVPVSFWLLRLLGAI